MGEYKFSCDPYGFIWLGWRWTYWFIFFDLEVKASKTSRLFEGRGLAASNSYCSNVSNWRVSGFEVKLSSFGCSGMLSLHLASSLSF